MISCARLAVPGMIVSMFLAGQALASNTPPADEEAVLHKMPPASVEQKKPSIARMQAARRTGRARLERPATFAENDPILLGASTGPKRWKQIGMASWYGGVRWQGHRTASGTRYDEHELTAAHASLPLGSKVRVSAEATGRSVIVTINDRPGTRSRVIDLSYEAAKELGLLQRGVALVTLSPM
jgi:rare lipoprotein A (peptidoglycan hydrolase)